MWAIKRHRFTEPHPDDPLPRRRPTPDHPYTADKCATCEHTYALDEGLRGGPQFFHTAHEAAALLMAVGASDSVRQATAQTRRDAVRYRPYTASHGKIPDDVPEPVPSGDLEALAHLDVIVAEGQIHDALYEDSDWDIRFRHDLDEEPESDPDWLNTPLFERFPIDDHEERYEDLTPEPSDEAAAPRMWRRRGTPARHPLRPARLDRGHDRRRALPVALVRARRGIRRRLRADRHGALPD